MTWKVIINKYDGRIRIVEWSLFRVKPYREIIICGESGIFFTKGDYYSQTNWVEIGWF